MNDFYTAPAAPVEFTRASATPIRAQFAAIEAAFDKLPSLAELTQGRSNYAVAGGTADALTAALAEPPLAYAEGLTVNLKIAATNTGAATLNLNGMGVVPIERIGGVALTGGELIIGTILPLVYVDGGFQLPATGPQGPQGIQGPAGGKDLLNGAVNPSGGVGANGDFYINTAAWTIFGPKAGGVWPAGVPILGADGADGVDGEAVLSGVGDPGGGVGVNGDFYIDTGDWQIFGPKAAGVWPAGVSLVGPAGVAGPPGTQDYSDVALTGTNTVNGQEIGFRRLTKSRTLTANGLVDADDDGKYVELAGAGFDITIQPNADEAIPTDTVISFIVTGTGPWALKRGSGVTLKFAGTGANANRTLAVGAYCWIHKTATNTWFVGGPGVT